MHIWPMDHNPPHFHILRPGDKKWAKYEILTKKQMAGNMRPNTQILSQWWLKNRIALVNKWNKLCDKKDRMQVPADWRQQR